MGWENRRVLIAGLSLHVAAMVNSSSRIIRITVLQANVYYTSSGSTADIPLSRPLSPWLLGHTANVSLIEV